MRQRLQSLQKTSSQSPWVWSVGAMERIDRPGYASPASGWTLKPGEPPSPFQPVPLSQNTLQPDLLGRVDRALQYLALWKSKTIEVTRTLVQADRSIRSFFKDHLSVTKYQIPLY